MNNDLNVRQTSKEAKDKAQPRLFCDPHCEREDDSQCWLQQELTGFQINHDGQHNHPLCVHLTLSFTLVLSPWSFYWFTYSSHCCRLVWEGRQTPKVAGVVYKRWGRLCPLKISTKEVEFSQEETLISFCLQIFYSVSQEGRVKEGLGSKRGDHKVGTCTTNTWSC